MSAPASFDLGPALLFCPADRPERFAKALERADAVILDLEDAVAPESKAAGREALIANALDSNRVIVRVNPPGTPAFGDDLAALARTDYRRVMVAKAEDPAEFDAFGVFGRIELIALCETARGVVAAETLAAHPAVVALMWGAEDLVASLGGTSSRHENGRYRDVARHARSRVLLAAGASGCAAIDSVYLDIPDVDGLMNEAVDAAAVGFTATACIHPSQVATIRAAYAPDAAAVAAAHTLLAAAVGKPGVFTHEGHMVDGPVLRHAEAVLRRAGLG